MPAPRRSKPHLHPVQIPARRAVPAWYAALIVVAGLLVYANSFAGPFIFDDWGAIEGNGTIRSLSDLSTIFSPPPEQPTAGRPLVNLSLALNYAAGGLDVRGYHAVNLAFHVACALLLFAIVRRTLELPSLRERFGARSTPLGFVVALLWLLHPLNTEVVDYLSQRTESLMALFFLTTFYAAIRDADSGARGWRVTAFLACAAGMACKESMVTAPVAVVLYDLAWRFGSVREAWKRRNGLYTALASTWLILIALAWSGPRAQTAGFSTSVSWWTYLLNQAVMLVRYLRLMLWPRDLVLNYGRPIPLSLLQVAPQAVLVLTLVALAVFAWTKRRSLGFVGIWFFMTLAPTTLVPIATEVGAERRMYLPLIAVIACVVLSTFSAYRHFRPAVSDAGGDRLGKALGLSAVVVLSLAFGAGVVARNGEYRSALAMSQTILDRWPSSVAEAMAGVASGEAGLHDAALAHFHNAVSQGYLQARYNLAVEQVLAGRANEAIENLQALLARSSEIDKTMVSSARRELADALFGQRKFDQASVQYVAYLAQQPDDADALDKLGRAQAALERYKEAGDAFRRLLALRPQSPETRINLVSTLLRAGQIAEASEQARRALALTPDDPRLLDLYARTLLAENKPDEAIRQFEQALRLDPTYVPAQQGLSALRPITPPAPRTVR